MVETLIKNFKQISKVDTEIAGGKGASLGEMIQAKIPVPEGFVILSKAFNQFIEETDLNVEIDAILDNVDIKEVHTIENASEKIQAMILSREMPTDIKTEILKFYKKLDCKFVAVRSSATSEDSASAAWAGQLDSFLNTTKKTLLENVKKCWASLFTPRAIFYRFEKKLSKDKISVAVVVQKMVDSEESGIAFSVHPVTQDENQIIIEAGFGLGEAIVSGSITPDSYVIDKQGFSILDINVNEQTKALYKKAKGGNEWIELGGKGKKQVLNEKEIIELSKLIVKIEKHYGFPCDIEWAKEKGEFYIVQSRPITTIQKSDSPDQYLTKEFTNTIKLFNDQYELFFSNQLAPLVALNYADELFFKEFESLCGNRYRIFSIIRNGWQQKFGLSEDIKKLTRTFENKINDEKWPKNLLNKYEEKAKKLRTKLEAISQKQFSDWNNDKLTATLEDVRSSSAILDAMSNMLHMFSSLVGHKFLIDLQKYSNDKEKINQNFIYFTQPIKESRFAKIIMPELNDKIDLDDREKTFSEILRVGSFVKDDVSELLDLRKQQTKSLFEEISSRLKCAIDDLDYLQINEIKNFLINEKNPTGLIKNRKQITILYYKERELLVYEGEKAISFLNEAKIKDVPLNFSGTEFVGQTASLGKIKGRVVVVQNSQEAIQKCQEGDILVAPYTAVEYLPAMKKAKAIVTETGGITSHAAIVSRELKIPCVIGIKDVTKILKDGDFIEINADEGIVYLLK